MHRQFLLIFLQNHEYVQTHCNDLKNPLHFAIRKWISQIN